jgi:peptide/nickel transport system substrate-binding protein
VRLDAQPGDVACGPGVVWASSPAAGTVTEISATAGAAVQSIHVGRGASTLALGAGALWVTNPPDGTVSRIDPRRGVVTHTIPLGTADDPAQVAVTDDAVWVSSEFGGTVARIDPERARVVEKLPVGNRPQGLAVVDGALWLGVADSGARHRGGTLRLQLGFQDFGWSDVDPSTTYSPEGIELLGAMHDGLTAFRRQGGAEGISLVAGLAETLPTPSDGGRTYTFRLRRGLTYSNGEPVRPSDVRFSIERAIRRHPAGQGLFGAIRGAAACTTKRCDVSRGIVADDAAGTVVVRLAQPDGDLLYKLALPYAAVLPASVGTEAPAKRALPTTGPYRIAAFEPKRLLRLERNPRFRSWSASARPDGFPDAITVKLGVSDEELLDSVLAGRADRVPGGVLAPPQLTALRRRVPGQLQTAVLPNTFYFVLNTRRAPFDSVDARRAVAFAFDRAAAVAALGGADVAQETCQILPPSFPGSRPYCPFTVAGTGGARGRPDLAAARRLVRRSGTLGARVTVRTPDQLPPELARLMARTLRELGYDASFRVLPTDRFFAALADAGSRTQIGFMAWVADIPSPSTFLHNFSCAAIAPNGPGNENPSRFCDRHADRLMAEAAQLQPIDPSAADALWARAERRIVDQVPAVAVYNRVDTELLSARVGNHQFSPVFGMLIDQAWVR